MARIWTCGFELQTVTVPIEMTATPGSIAPVISTTTVRSGLASLEATASASTCYAQSRVVASSSSAVPLFYRMAINVATLPGGAMTCLSIGNASSTACNIILNADGSYALYNGAGTQIGSNSSICTLNSWHVLEISIGASNATAARLDGVQFASGTGTLITGWHTVWYGMIDTETADLFFDDGAVNDNTGLSQNSFPGAGNVIRLTPNAAGDVNTFATQVGGTAGSANNFTRVNEVTPDDVTSYNESHTLNQEDLFKCTASGIPPKSNITVVQLGARYRDNPVDPSTKITFELEKASAGTKSTIQITPNHTGWTTNLTSLTVTYLAYLITLYNDPDGTAWSKATLDTIQIGYKFTATGTGSDGIGVSTIWAYVEYVPILSNVVNINQAVNRGSTY